MDAEDTRFCCVCQCPVGVFVHHPSLVLAVAYVIIRADVSSWRKKHGSPCCCDGRRERKGVYNKSVPLNFSRCKGVRHPPPGWEGIVTASYPIKTASSWYGAETERDSSTPTKGFTLRASVTAGPAVKHSKETYSRLVLYSWCQQLILALRKTLWNENTPSCVSTDTLSSLTNIWEAEMDEKFLPLLQSQLTSLFLFWFCTTLVSKISSRQLAASVYRLILIYLAWCCFQMHLMMKHIFMRSFSTVHMYYLDRFWSKNVPHQSLHMEVDYFSAVIGEGSWISVLFFKLTS